MQRGRPVKVRPIPLVVDEVAELQRRRELGGRVRQQRLQVKLTMRDLAAKSGYSSEEIRRLENGSADAKMSTLLQIAVALECAVRWLLLGEGEP